MEEKASPGVAAVDRALAILNAFRLGDDRLTLANLAQRTGLYKSTILRLLGSLERQRFVVRLGDGTYRLGPEVFQLGHIYQRSFRIEDHVKPVLDRLATQTEESASFFTNDGDTRFCLYRAESTRRVRHTVQVGELLPMNRGVGGKVLTTFAAGADHADPRDVEALPYLALGRDELDIAVMGGPVFGPRGVLVGVICVSGPTLRFTPDAVTRLSSILIRELRQLTAEIGGDPHWFDAVGGAVPATRRMRSV